MNATPIDWSDLDSLEDICPICGDFIDDDEEWANVTDWGICHLECVEGPAQ